MKVLLYTTPYELLSARELRARLTVDKVPLQWRTASSFSASNDDESPGCRAVVLDPTLSDELSGIIEKHYTQRRVPVFRSHKALLTHLFGKDGSHGSQGDTPASTGDSAGPSDDSGRDGASSSDAASGEVRVVKKVPKVPPKRTK